MSKKDAFIIRDFNDAGTLESFTGGKIVSIEEGAFLNYKAAGLVRAPADGDRKVDKSGDIATAAGVGGKAA